MKARRGQRSRRISCRRLLLFVPVIIICAGFLGWTLYLTRMRQLRETATHLESNDPIRRSAATQRVTARPTTASSPAPTAATRFYVEIYENEDCTGQKVVVESDNREPNCRTPLHQNSAPGALLRLTTRLEQSHATISALRSSGRVYHAHGESIWRCHVYSR